MSKNHKNKKYLFIDESGDPDFYGGGKKLLVGTPGFQPYLIIGMIETQNRRLLHKTVVAFMDSIKNSRLYNTIPSVAANNWYVHARSDHPEVRAKFFEVLSALEGYTANIVIGKKDLGIFNKKHNSNPSEFYFDLIHHLLSDRLNDPDTEYNIFLSQRRNNTLHMFNNAVINAINAGNKKRNEPVNINYKLEIVPSVNMPELSIVDYFLWAVQRKLLKGESRFLDILETRYESILNIYGEG